MPERVQPGSGDEPAFVYEKHRRAKFLADTAPAAGARMTDGDAVRVTDTGDTRVVD